MALVVLGTSSFDLRVDQPTIVGATLLTVAEGCCAPEVGAGHADAGHASECLPVCGGGQAVLPGSPELPLPAARDFRPEPDMGADARFADLEPHPPKRSSEPI